MHTRRKILSMCKNLWRIKVSSIIRNNSFQYVNQSESLRIAFVNWRKRSQPSAKLRIVSANFNIWRKEDDPERISAIFCELKRIFAHHSDLNPTHDCELERSEGNGKRMHANHYEAGN